MLGVGDYVPGSSSRPGTFDIIPERKTILEILSVPDTNEQITALVRDIIEKYHSEGRTGVT